MKSRRVIVSLSDEQTAWLEKEATRRGISQASLVRYALAAALPGFPDNIKVRHRDLAEYRSWIVTQSNDYDPYSDQEGMYSYKWWVENVKGK